MTSCFVCLNIYPQKLRHVRREVINRCFSKSQEREGKVEGVNCVPVDEGWRMSPQQPRPTVKWLVSSARGCPTLRVDFHLWRPDRRTSGCQGEPTFAQLSEPSIWLPESDALLRP